MTNMGTNTSNSRTIKRQEEQKQQNQQNQQQHYNYNHQDNYNNNHARARAREDAKGCTDEQMRMIANAYRANVCERITPAVAHMIEDAIASGMDIDTVIWACEETGLAPNPSPRYLRAVLRNWSFRGHVSSRVHCAERDIIIEYGCGPWQHLTKEEYRAASIANGEDPDDELWYV